MTREHLTEEEIQAYALGKLGESLSVDAHLQTCEQCATNLRFYQLLFAGIKQQPEPVFDFDLSEAVLAQLPAAPQKRSSENFLFWILALVVVVLSASVFYIFGRRILDLFAGIIPFSIYLTATAVLVVSAGIGFDMYKSYEEKIKAVEFS